MKDISIEPLGTFERALSASRRHNRAGTSSAKKEQVVEFQVSGIKAWRLYDSPQQLGAQSVRIYILDYASANTKDLDYLQAAGHLNQVIGWLSPEGRDYLIEPTHLSPIDDLVQSSEGKKLRISTVESDDMTQRKHPEENLENRLSSGAASQPPRLIKSDYLPTGRDFESRGCSPDYESRIRERESRMSPEQYALWRRFEALRREFGSVTFDVAEARREFEQK